MLDNAQLHPMSFEHARLCVSMIVVEIVADKQDVSNEYRPGITPSS
jgi:hypothetical protein